PGEENFSEGGPGEPSSAGTDPAAAPYQRSGNARLGSRPVEVELVTQSHERRCLGSLSCNSRKQRRLGNATFPCQQNLQPKRQRMASGQKCLPASRAHGSVCRCSNLAIRLYWTNSSNLRPVSGSGSSTPGRSVAATGCWPVWRSPAQP